MKAQSVILLHWINWENEKKKYTAKFRKVESPLFTNYSGKFPIWTPTPLKRKKLQQPFSISFLRTKKSPHSLGVRQDTMRLLPLLKLFFVILWPLNLYRMGLFRAAHGWGGKKAVKHIPQWWNLAVISYLKKIEKTFKSRYFEMKVMTGLPLFFVSEILVLGEFRRKINLFLGEI